MIGDAANRLWNPWSNDRATLEVYRKRCRLEDVEMTCAGQAAEILKDKVRSGESLLDAGCGGGYYYWSFQRRGIHLHYHGLDYTPELIEMARTEICPRAGLSEEQFALGRIENLESEFDSIICFNVLTNNPHYALPLERLLRCARKRILIRESLGEGLKIHYASDPFLDSGKQHIRVYHNTYPLKEVEEFMKEFGFKVTRIFDERSRDGVEIVVGVRHTWRILLGERE